MNPDKSPLWRQISEKLVKQIDDGQLQPGKRLPSTRDLAGQLGVNRNTVLRAISHLQDEGLLRTEQGRRGTYIAENAIQYRLGSRTRFEENLLEMNTTPNRELDVLKTLPATEDIAKALNLAANEDVTLVSLIGKAEETPLSYSHNYFPTKRMPNIIEIFREMADDPDRRISISGALSEVGVVDFHKTSLRVRARPSTIKEAHIFKIPTPENVLEILVTNVDSNDVPVMHALTCFPCSRIEFTMDL